MLKLSLVVAAALLGTAAIAQDANAPSAMPSDSSATTPAATDAAATPSPDAGMTQGAGTTSATPDMSAPTSSTTTADASAVATRSYPRCSRTVTDSCIQGGARKRNR